MFTFFYPCKNAPILSATIVYVAYNNIAHTAVLKTGGEGDLFIITMWWLD